MKSKIKNTKMEHRNINFSENNDKTMKHIYEQDTGHDTDTDMPTQYNLKNII